MTPDDTQEEASAVRNADRFPIGSRVKMVNCYGEAPITGVVVARLASSTVRMLPDVGRVDVIADIALCSEPAADEVIADLVEETPQEPAEKPVEGDAATRMRRAAEKINRPDAKPERPREALQMSLF